MPDETQSQSQPSPTPRSKNRPSDSVTAISWQGTYLMDSMTSLKLARVIGGEDPKSIPPPRPTDRGLGDPDLTQDAIRASLAPIRPVSENEVLVEIFGTWLDIEIIIITQDCRLPASYNLPLPVATQGEREELVRQWLEKNGVSKDEYKWGIREDDSTEDSEDEDECRFLHLESPCRHVCLRFERSYHSHRCYFTSTSTSCSSLVRSGQSGDLNVTHLCQRERCMKNSRITLAQYHQVSPSLAHPQLGLTSLARKALVLPPTTLWTALGMWNVTCMLNIIT